MMRTKKSQALEVDPPAAKSYTNRRRPALTSSQASSIAEAKVKTLTLCDQQSKEQHELNCQLIKIKIEKAKLDTDKAKLDFEKTKLEMQKLEEEHAAKMKVLQLQAKSQELNISVSKLNLEKLCNEKI